MKIHEKLRLLRREKGWSQSELAEKLAMQGCGVSQKAVSRWERGDSEPSLEQFLKLCALYGVRDVLNVFCALPDEQSKLNALGRKRVGEYIRLLSNDEEFCSEVPLKPASKRMIALYELPVSAGTGQFLDSSDYELIEADETVPEAASFAVRISGQSMMPRFVDRQIVYVRQQQTLEPGEVGIFILNGNAYCKQLGQKELISFNVQYEPIPVREYDELRVLGKVIG